MSVSTLEKTKGGAKSAVADEAPAKGGKKKLIVIVVAVLVAAGAGYFFLGRSGSSGPPKDMPGAVVKLDPIQINLSGEHYLRVAVALQMTTTAEAEVDGSKAQDEVIATFSGRPIAQVNDPATRTKLKAQLLASIRELYEKKVMDVYFTEFVTQ